MNERAPLTLKIRQYPLQMVIDWNVWHPDFSPGKTFQPQRHASTRNKLCENSTKPLKIFSSLSDDFWACDATKKVAILVGVVSHLRAQSRTSDSLEPNETNHLINLLLPESCPSRTEWWVKWLPTLRLHLEKASLSPFVCYFCVFVCREHAYPPKEDDSLFLSYLMRDEGGIASKWICWEAEYLSMKHFVCGAAGL